MIHFAVNLKLTQRCKSTILQHKIKIILKDKIKFKKSLDYFFSAVPEATPTPGLFLMEPVFHLKKIFANSSVTCNSKSPDSIKEEEFFFFFIFFWANNHGK